jgi:hypothetical protein
MISLTDLAVVMLAVGVVLTGVLTVRWFLRRAQQPEDMVDDPPLSDSSGRSSPRH